MVMTNGNGPVQVKANKGSVLSPVELRKSVFEKYAYFRPESMPALKGRLDSGYINANQLLLSPTRNDDVSWFAMRISDLMRMGNRITDRIAYAILNAKNELMKREDVRNVEVTVIEVNTINPLSEKGKPPTLFYISLYVKSKKPINETSKRYDGNYEFNTHAALVVSTAKETDIDAHRIVNFSNRIGKITFVSLHEQNPAEKPRGHYGEQMRAQVAELTHQLEATKEALEVREKAIRELNGQVTTLEKEVKQKEGTIKVLRNVADSLRTLITNALRTLREAGLGNRTKSIEAAVTELEQEKHYKA